jgi:hypothetical protein
VELRLFCAQRKQKALGQGVACLLPPKLEGHTCEKVCSPSSPLLALSFLKKGLASGTLMEKRDLEIGDLANVRNKGKLSLGVLGGAAVRVGLPKHETTIRLQLPWKSQKGS